MDKVYYECKVCGARFDSHLGRCQSCRAWNTLVKKTYPSVNSESFLGKENSQVFAIGDVPTPKRPRLKTGITELDRVFGGGLVTDAVLLFGGYPGAGKSTLLMQASYALAEKGLRILYASGEESLSQLKARADRLQTVHPNLLVIKESDIGFVLHKCEEREVDLLIVDSLQTAIPDDPGATEKEKKVTLAVCNFAKKRKTPAILVNHVTKDLELSGPKAVQHLVDGVFYLTTEDTSSFRLLRASKYRDGAVDEVGIFEMGEKGMVGVSNPSSYLSLDRSEARDGSCFAITLKGNRPILVEVQALFSERLGRKVVANGTSSRRIEIMLTLLSRGDFIVAEREVYVNVVGGVQVETTDADLATVVALASSYRNIPVERDLVFLGEVGLAGEVRGISHVKARLGEAERLGFRRVVLPQVNFEKILASTCDVIPVREISEVLEIIEK